MKSFDGIVMNENDENRLGKFSPKRTQLVPISPRLENPNKQKLLKFDKNLINKFFKNEGKPRRSSICLTPSPATKISFAKVKKPSVLDYINSKLESKELKIKQEPLNVDFFVTIHKEFTMYKEYLAEISQLICSFDSDIHKSMMRALANVSAVFNKLIIKCAQGKTEIVFMPIQKTEKKNALCENSTQTITEPTDFDEIELDNIKSLNDKAKSINLARITNRLSEVNQSLISMYGEIPKLSDAPNIPAESYYKILKMVYDNLKSPQKFDKNIQTDFEIIKEKCIQEVKIENLGQTLPKKTKKAKIVIEAKNNFKSEPGFNISEGKINELEFELVEIKRKYNKLVNENSKNQSNGQKLKVKTAEKETNVSNAVYTEVYLKCKEDIEMLKKIIAEKDEKILEFESAWVQFAGKPYPMIDLKSEPEAVRENKNEKTSELRKKNLKILNENPEPGKKKLLNVKRVKELPQRLNVFLSVCRMAQQDFKIFPKLPRMQPEILRDSYEIIIKTSTLPLIIYKPYCSDSVPYSTASNEPLAEIFSEPFQQIPTEKRPKKYSYGKFEANLFKALNDEQWEIFEDYKIQKKRYKYKKNKDSLRKIAKNCGDAIEKSHKDALKLTFFRIFSRIEMQHDGFLVQKAEFSVNNANQVKEESEFLSQVLGSDSNLPESFHFQLKRIHEEHLSKKCSPPCVHLRKALALKSVFIGAIYPISKVNII